MDHYCLIWLIPENRLYFARVRSICATFKLNIDIQSCETTETKETKETKDETKIDIHLIVLQGEK